MSSTFETLSEEVLLIIFRCSANVFGIFRAFLGLNQRLNHILLDRRSHLLADFLYINTHDITFTDYYKSDVFENVSYQLSCMHSPINDQQLRQCLQSLVTFHIHEEFIRLQNQVQSKLVAFERIRQRLSDIEIVDRDNQLREIFFDLKNNKITNKTIKQIESLIVTNGARLQCDNYELNQFNLAKALNRFLFCYLNNIHSVHRSLIQMFKTLIVSNTRVLMNRDRTEIEESSSIWFFLFYSIYQLQYYYYTPPDVFINMKCYNAVIHLLLFAIHCQIQTNSDEQWARESLFDILKMIPSDEVSNKNELFIQSIQWEILKIIIDQYILSARTSWQEEQDNAFRSILSDLLKKNRLDILHLLYHRLQYVQSYFNQPNNIYQNVNILTGSSKGRQLFKIFINETPLKSWLISKELIFMLLRKKERKFLQKLLQTSPFLIHQIDEDGNDLLLYTCLKVRGCRHRIIEFLIIMGCNLQRRNFHNENFIDALQLRRNQSLLKDLLKNEIIEIDDQTKEIQVIQVSS
jgi:hypothetical protein